MLEPASQKYLETIQRKIKQSFANNRIKLRLKNKKTHKYKKHTKHANIKNTQNTQTKKWGFKRSNRNF